MTRSLRMLLLLAVPVGVLAAGCADDEDPAPLRAATATIESLLPVDGCSYPVTIDDVRHAPDAASVAELRERSLAPRATVEIQYRLTGETGQVRCGRALETLPEITIVFP